MKHVRRRRLIAGAAVAGLAVSLLPAGPATAEPATAEPATAGPASTGPDAPSVTVEVVADHLNVPRGLTYDPYLGRVLVAEAGYAEGNDGACEMGFSAVMCYGETGSVYQYSEHWWLESERIIEGLPSLHAPELLEFGYEVVVGLHDVALPWGTGSPVGVFGLNGSLSFRDALAASHPRAEKLATLSQLHPNGTVQVLADYGQYEADVNPHPAVMDTGPYGVSAEHLEIVVADAGGNFIGRTSLFEELETVAVIPSYIDENGESWEPVPTTVTRGPDGNYYVGELSAGFSPPRIARVWKLTPDGELTLEAGGFHNISDITFDHQGRLIVLEFADGYYTGGRAGRLLRVEDDGSVTVLLDGLHTPGGVVETEPGVFYVTNRSATLGGNGELLRVTVDG